MEDAITPPTIPDQAVPLINGGTTSVAGTTTDPVTSGAEIPDKAPNPPIPQTVIATDTVATSINTETKKILGEYEFEQLGAIQIGEFKQAVSGDIKISPDGITATNKEGEKSFHLDGETGDATFKGTVQAKDFVIADKDGLISLSNFKSNGAFNGSAGVSTAVKIDVPGSTLDSFTLKRNSNVLLILMGYGFNDAALTSHMVDDISLNIVDSFDGLVKANLLWFGYPWSYTPDAITFYQGVQNQLISRVGLVYCEPGIHQLKLTVEPLGGGTANLNAWEIGYVILGS